MAGDFGAVRIFDLGASTTDAVVELHVPTPKNGTENERVLALQFNPKQRDFLACGDAAGRVHVWQLSWRLSNAQPAELENLEAFSNNLDS